MRKSLECRQGLSKFKFEKEVYGYRKKAVFEDSFQTVDKALLLQGFAIVGTAFLI